MKFHFQAATHARGHWLPKTSLSLPRLSLVLHVPVARRSPSANVHLIEHHQRPIRRWSTGSFFVVEISFICVLISIAIAVAITGKIGITALNVVGSRFALFVLIG